VSLQVKQRLNCLIRSNELNGVTAWDSHAAGNYHYFEAVGAGCQGRSVGEINFPQTIFNGCGNTDFSQGTGGIEDQVFDFEDIIDGIGFTSKFHEDLESSVLANGDAGGAIDFNFSNGGCCEAIPLVGCIGVVGIALQDDITLDWEGALQEVGAGANEEVTAARLKSAIFAQRSVASSAVTNSPSVAAYGM
jgi:hypothetical protein